MADNENNTPRRISRSERTNAKNLENLHIARDIIATIGNFNPTNELITAEELENFERQFTTNVQDTNAAQADEDTAVDEQTVAFTNAKSKLTKIVAAVKGQGINGEPLEGIMQTVRRLRGARVNRNTPDETPPVATNSVSQQSMAGIINGLDILEEQVKNLQSYNPNEDEYKTAQITAWVDSLRTVHNNRLAKRANTISKRQTRDSYGYGTTGLLVRMNALKAYAETLLDKNDPRLKALKALKFVDTSIK